MHSPPLSSSHTCDAQPAVVQLAHPRQAQRRVCGVERAQLLASARPQHMDGIAPINSDAPGTILHRRASRSG